MLVNWFASEPKDMVAQTLGLSTSTVNSYIHRVRRAAATKAALVARAIQHGLVRVEHL
jgi:two-component system, NarL family, nitrate/nitrite response regulator NarL